MGRVEMPSLAEVSTPLFIPSSPVGTHLCNSDSSLLQVDSRSRDEGAVTPHQRQTS